MTEHFSKPLAMEKVIEAIGNYSKKKLKYNQVKDIIE